MIPPPQAKGETVAERLKLVRSPAAPFRRRVLGREPERRPALSPRESCRQPGERLGLHQGRRDWSSTSCVLDCSRLWPIRGRGCGPFVAEVVAHSWPKRSEGGPHRQVTDAPRSGTAPRPRHSPTLALSRRRTPWRFKSSHPHGDYSVGSRYAQMRWSFGSGELPSFRTTNETACSSTSRRWPRGGGGPSRSTSE